MAGSRSTPPLFDLLRRSSERSEEVKPSPQSKPAPPPPPPRPAPSPAMNKPVVRLDTTPRSSPRPEAAPAPQRPSPSPATSRPASRQTLTVAILWVWLAMAGVLASWLLIWGVAYNMGQSAEARRLGPYGELADSSAPPASRQPNVVAKPPVIPDKGSAKPTSGQPLVPKQAPAPAPVPMADSRQSGFNYLLCASQLDQTTAEAAAGFLTRSGVPATAVAGGKAGKYTVYTLLGIPSGSLDEKLKERNDHKAEVARLGKIWKKDHPGSPDFADAYWEKYKP